MADKRNELVDLLLRRFKGVPNFEDIDAVELVDEALAVHDDKTPSSLLLLYAQSQGAWQIAFSVAHYFSFRDGEEEVDKSSVADNYRRLARDLDEQYQREKAKVFGNNFRLAPRADRPRTTPPTGESGGRRAWRRY